MTKHETAKLLAVLAAAFPRFEVDDLKVQVWHELLGDLDYGVLQLAIQKLILENPYSPTIADIRKRAAEIMTPQEEMIDAAGAWGEVVRAVRKYGYYCEAEALESMSPQVAKVVRCIGWREICLSEEPGVVRGQFLKMYQQVSEREQKMRLLPQSLRDEIQKLAGHMKFITGGSGG